MTYPKHGQSERRDKKKKNGEEDGGELVASTP